MQGSFKVFTDLLNIERILVSPPLAVSAFVWDGEREGTYPEDHEKVCARTEVPPSGKRKPRTLCCTYLRPGTEERNTRTSRRTTRKPTTYLETTYLETKPMTKQKTYLEPETKHDPKKRTLTLQPLT